MEGRVKSKKEYDYTVLFEPAAEEGYVVTCPALPGLVTEGDTLEEARAMAKDTIEGFTGVRCTVAESREKKSQTSAPTSSPLI